MEKLPVYQPIHSTSLNISNLRTCVNRKKLNTSQLQLNLRIQRLTNYRNNIYAQRAFGILYECSIPMINRVPTGKIP